MTGTILDRIVAARRDRVSSQGHAQGEQVPAQRTVPVVPFGRDPFIICEIKRKSPSRGDIGLGADPVLQAAKYVSRGIQSISVLTEPEFFGGSLQDLQRVKQQYPQVALLRKDFLLDVEDVNVSYRAGADAILLIASILEPELLAAMHNRAQELGMQALVELHTAEELESIRPLAPPLMGVNSRDLKTFRMDPLVPLRLRACADWDARWVYESGVFEQEHSALAVSHGFHGVLVGEAVMRSPDRIAGMAEGLAFETRIDFWSRVAALIAANSRPLVKICGLVWREDVMLAEQAGADLLGFVFADSPRRADPAMVAALGKTRALKIGVVVTSPSEGRHIPPDVQQLLTDGCLDAIQFSGDEQPDECFPQAFPYYKTVRIGSENEISQLQQYHSPRVLIDARSPDGRYGGSGHRIPPELIEKIPGPLWLAGGLNPANIAEVVRSFQPELVDVSSGLESHPGKKDPRKVTAFMEEIHNGTA